MTSLIGSVSWMHPRSTRVQVDIPGRDGIPLSIKAHFDGFDRHLFCKGRVVEVRESNRHDRRCFMINRVFDEVKPIVVCNLKISVPNADALRKEKPMDKVKFYLNSNYFDHPELKGVLSRVFKFRPGEFSGTRCQGTGVTFVCTTDQFARFLIERNQNGIKNGFMDLGAKLVRPTSPPNAYDLLAKAAGITHDQAKRVALALCYGSPTEIMERIKADSHTPKDHAHQIDVSDR